jgi:hypothetical protein
MWFLFVGIFFLFTGFGTPIGILLLALFFLTEMRNSKPSKQYNENTFNINNLNITADPKDFAEDDVDTPIEHMSKDVKEEMR